MKSEPLRTLFAAIEKVLAGGEWLTADLAGRLERGEQEWKAVEARPGIRLTEREVDVLRLVVEDGLPPREIALRLGVSLGNVKNRLTAICGKFQVPDREALVLLARRRTILPAPLEEGD